MICYGACDDFNCTGCEKFNEIVDRIAAYKDTGLEPEDIDALQKRERGLTEMLVNVSCGCVVPYTRLAELAQAEKDGRLVILPPNDPLTLEELREMDGEPVWVTPLYGRSPMWCFVVVPLDDADKGYARNQTRRFGTVCNGIAGHFKIYGRTWLAYRRRTEEGEK